MATYVLFNVHGKWKLHCDQIFFDLVFPCPLLILQLFLRSFDCLFVENTSKIVHSVVLTGIPELVSDIMKAVHTMFQIGTISSESGHL